MRLIPLSLRRGIIGGCVPCGFGGDMRKSLISECGMTEGRQRFCKKAPSDTLPCARVPERSEGAQLGFSPAVLAEDPALDKVCTGFTI